MGDTVFVFYNKFEVLHYFLSRGSSVKGVRSFLFILNYNYRIFFVVFVYSEIRVCLVFIYIPLYATSLKLLSMSSRGSGRSPVLGAGICRKSGIDKVSSSKSLQISSVYNCISSQPQLSYECYKEENSNQDCPNGNRVLIQPLHITINLNFVSMRFYLVLTSDWY